jgi:hypothetical protein
MDHTTTQDSIRLNVNMPSPRTGGTCRLLADIKKRSIRSRLLTTLFGEQHEVVIILPSRNVDNVTFTHAQKPERGAEK